MGVSDELASASHAVTLHHRELTNTAGLEAQFDAVVSLFLLDAVASLPAAVSAIAKLLRFGGVWVNYGPLRKHREARPFTFGDISLLAEANGLSVVEDRRLSDIDYVP